MSVNITKYDNEKITYDLLPEEVNKQIVNDIKLVREDNETTNGYNKSRSMRHIGSIPYSFMYNYAMYKGVSAEKHSEFYSEDNGKNIIKLLEKFKAFKTVDKPL